MTFGATATLNGNLFSGWILSFKKTKRGQTNSSVGRGRQAESYRGSDGYWGCLVYRKSQREAQKEGPTAAVGLGVVLQEVLRRCILTREQGGQSSPLNNQQTKGKWGYPETHPLLPSPGTPSPSKRASPIYLTPWACSDLQFHQSSLPGPHDLRSSQGLVSLATPAQWP